MGFKILGSLIQILPEGFKIQESNQILSPLAQVWRQIDFNLAHDCVFVFPGVPGVSTTTSTVVTHARPPSRRVAASSPRAQRTTV